MNALRKKIETGMNERLKQREIEHNKLLQRYQNVKKELENQQNLERIKVEKSFTRPGTASFSRSQAMNQSKMSYSSSKMGNGKTGVSLVSTILHPNLLINEILSD